MYDLLSDAFGNALGSSFVDSMRPTQGVGAYSAGDYTNEMDKQSDSYKPLIDYADVESQIAEGPLYAENSAFAGRRSVSTDHPWRSGYSTRDGAIQMRDLPGGHTWEERRLIELEPVTITGSRRPTPAAGLMIDPETGLASFKFTSEQLTAGGGYGVVQDLAPTTANAMRLGLIGGNGQTDRVWTSSAMRDVSVTVVSAQATTEELYGSLAEGASNAQYLSAGLDSGIDAAGKAAGAIKLLPAGALQQARVENLMSAKNLEAAQSLIKGPRAKSAIAMADYSVKYAGTFKALPYLGATLAIAEESNRIYRAEGAVETSKVVAVGTGNYLADGLATSGGAWVGAKTGAVAGAAFGSVVPIVGTGFGAIVGGGIGAVVGGVTGHWVYDTQAAPRLRAQFIGEHFRDSN